MSHALTSQVAQVVCGHMADTDAPPPVVLRTYLSVAAGMLSSVEGIAETETILLNILKALSGGHRA